MKIIAPPVLIYLLTVIEGFLIHNFFPLYLFNAGAWLIYLSFSLIIFSLVMTIWAITSMRLAKTTINPYKVADKLITTGAFQISRNPLYLAMTSGYFALCFFSNSLWLFILYIPLLTVMLWGVILREEAMLQEKFAEQYTKYKESVRRWI